MLLYLNDLYFILILSILINRFLKILLFAGKREDGQEYAASIYQKAQENLDTAIQLSWSAGSSEARFGIGCAYKIDDGCTVRAKVNNQSQVGLGYAQKVRDGKRDLICLFVLNNF